MQYVLSASIVDAVRGEHREQEFFSVKFNGMQGYECSFFVSALLLFCVVYFG